MKILATHTVGNIKKIKSGITAGAILTLCLIDDRLEVHVQFKSHIGDLSQVPYHLAEEVYHQICEWCKDVVRHARIYRVVFPGISPNGVWPYLDQVINNIKQLGVECSWE